MRCKQNQKIKIKIHKIEKSYSKDDDQVDYKKNNDSNNCDDRGITLTAYASPEVD